MMLDEPSVTLLEALTNPLGTDLVRAIHLTKSDRITRSEWLEMEFPDGVPDPWTAEHEAELPPGLRSDGLEIPPHLPRKAHQEP
jgi:hypothetical protein